VSLPEVLPTFHIRPTRGWINDPNGLTRRDGRWHVFFQHNPLGPAHRRIHWGHVSSSDLVDWAEHPVAFGPQDGGPDEFGCWSGVFVDDDDTPAVVYSGVTDESGQSTVCLRTGSPDLLTWSDPVVVARTPEDAGVDIMRDPFVVEVDGRRWALVGAGLVDGSAAILLFDCADLREWEFVEVWLTSADPVLGGAGTAQIWECPQLVRVGSDAVLIVSLWYDGRLGDVIAAVGTLESDSGRPRFTPGTAQRADLGRAFYAPQAVADAGGDEGPLVFGWIRQDDQDPATRTVAGCLTLPRRLRVEGGHAHLIADPATELIPVAEPVAYEAGEHALPAHARIDVVGPARGGWVLSANRPAGTASEGHTHVAAPLGVLETGARIWVDATTAEVYPGDARPPTTLRSGGGAWRLHVPGGAHVLVAEVLGARVEGLG